MKKLIFFLVLFLFGCRATTEWYENREHFTFSEVIDQYHEWIDNPNKLILDFSPMLLEYPDYILEKDGDTLFFELTANQKYQNEQAQDMLNFNQKLWNELTPQNIIETVNENYVVIKNEPDQFYFSVLDISENILYTVLISAPVLFIPGAGGTKIARETENISKLAIFATKDIMKIFRIDELNIILRKGSNKFGMKHILREHTPMSFIERGLDPKKLKKTLFLTSDEKYIQKLIQRFCNSPNITLIESESVFDYYVYTGKIECDAGIMRRYKMIINKESNNIISFYPINDISLNYIWEKKYSNYIKETYKKEIQWELYN